MEWKADVENIWNVKEGAGIQDHIAVDRDDLPAP